MLNKTYFKWLWIVFCFIVYILFAMSSLGEPFMADNLHFTLAAKILNKEYQPLFKEDFGLWHPPAYVHLLALIDKLIGLNPVSARLVGIVCFFLSLILVFEISLKLFKNNPNSKLIAAIACLLFSINPLSVRGSLIVDIDNSILNLTLLFFTYFLIVDYSAPNSKNIFWGGLLFTLVLWTKLTTPLILLFSFLVFLLFKKEKRLLLRACAIFSIGIALFFISWKFYCLLYKRQYLALFSHLSRTFFYLESRSSILYFAATMIKTFISLLLWLSPFLVIIFYLLIKERTKIFFGDKKVLLSDLMLIYCLFILFFYLLIGGLSHGVPKYYFPMVPILSILVAKWISDRVALIKKNINVFIFLVLLVVIYNIFLVGDPVYMSYHALKEAIVRGLPLEGIINKNINGMIFLFIPFILIFLFSKRIFKNQTLATALIICAFASNISLDILQSRADYNTVYCYGAKGTKEVINFLDPKVGSKDFLLAPNEIIWGVSSVNHTSYEARTYYNDVSNLLKIAKRYQPLAIVYGISSNTIEQYRLVYNNEETQKFLNKNFTRYDIDDYTVWFKKRN